MQTIKAGTAAVLAFPAAHAAAVPPLVHYACSAAPDLIVQRDRSTAHVTFDGRTYDLQRRPSSIGAKYLSQNAALIVDGGSATFVSEHRLDLGTCTRAVPLASADRR